MLAHGWRRLLMLFLAGALAGLSVPPFFLLPVLFVAFPVWVWALDGAERRRSWFGRLFGPAFAIGFAFGLGYFLVAFHWLGAAFFVDGGIMLVIITALYLWPRTAPLGAVLLTGYLGGAIATHLRIGSPWLSHTLFGVYVGAVAWLVVGSLMAHWLFWQTKTTGAWLTAANTRASLTSPWLFEPSPKYATTAVSRVGSPVTTSPSRCTPIA